MHAGFHVLRVDVETAQMATADTFDTAGELAYGAAWHARASSGGGLVASCTFYDHNLQLWRADAKTEPAE